MNRLTRLPGIYELAPPIQSSEEFEKIGTSVEGRSLIVQYCGNPTAALRIFMVAGQHGDEPDARLAASAYLAKFRRGSLRIGARLAILTDANPDGAAVHRRRNASDIDLNRDHLLLCAPETSDIHSFVYRWRPDLIVDVHTYRPWRPELVQYDFVFPHDVMVDVPTNPAARTGLLPGLKASLLEFVKLRMAAASFRCDRYTLVRRSGIVRHSNLDILDARNSLSLRYGIPTVLIEGRRGSSDDPPMFTTPHLALLRSIEAVVEWADRNAHRIKRHPGDSPSPGPIPVRCRYTKSKSPRYMEMQSATTGNIQRVGIPGDYLPFVRTTKTIHAPRAYAVPRGCVRLLETLARQRFQTAPPDRFRRAAVEVYRILGSAPAPAEENAPLPTLCALRAADLDLDGVVLFPTDQPGGHALALFLEPISQFGLHRFSQLELGLSPGMMYPVARIL